MRGKGSEPRFRRPVNLLAEKRDEAMAYSPLQRSTTTTLTAVADTFPRWSMLSAVAALLASFAMLLSGHGSLILQGLEQRVDDFRTAFFSDRIAGDHPKIVIVSVGENVSPTRVTLEKKVDFDRGQLARLIDAIDDSAPVAIGFDVPLAGAGDPAKDQALQRSLREAKGRVVLGIRGSGADVIAERRVWLDRFIAGTGRPTGHITTLYDGARAVRVDSGVQAIGAVPDSFSLLMARALRPTVERDFGNISWLQKVDDSGLFSRFLNLDSQSPFLVLSAASLIDNTKPLPTSQLRGRLVLVTTGLAEMEWHRTPLTIWTGETYAPIQIQAQAIAQLLEGRSTSAMSPRGLRMGLFTLACLAGLIGWYRGPGWHIPGTLLALGIILALDAMLYSSYGLTLPLVPALLLWLLGEIAGRNLRRVLGWEERYGHRWPLPEAEAR